MANLNYIKIKAKVNNFSLNTKMHCINSHTCETV